jgi:hypothetical protein
LETFINRRKYEDFGPVQNNNSYEVQKQIDNLQSYQTELIDKYQRKKMIIMD